MAVVPARDEAGGLIDFEQELLALDESEGDEFQLAATAVRALVSLAKAARSYEDGHKILTDLRGKLFGLLSQYLKRFHTLVLQIDENSFTMQGRTLYACEDLKSSVPFLFYRDGIRELRFLHGLDEQELDRFLQIIRSSDQVNHLEDDLVTLLWEQEFTTIDFLAVDSLLDEANLLSCDTVEEFRASRAAGPPAHQIEVLGEQGLEALDDLPLVLPEKALYRLTDDERQALQREAQAVGSSTDTLNAVALMFDMLPLAQAPEVYEAEVKRLGRLLDELFVLGQQLAAGMLLLRAGELLANGRVAEWKQPALRQLFSIPDEAQWRELFRVRLTERTTEAAPALAALMLLRPSRTLPVVLRMLEDAGNGVVRRTLEAALVSVGQARLDNVLSLLEGSSKGQLRECVRVLGIIGDGRAAPYLGKLLAHRDAAIRLESLTALARIDSEPAFRLVLRSMDDADETVRCRAAELCGRQGGETAYQALLGKVTARDFRSKSPAEIKALLIAFAACHNPGVLVTLRQLAGAGGSNTVRRCAQQILQAIDPASPPASRGYLSAIGQAFATLLHPRAGGGR